MNRFFDGRRDIGFGLMQVPKKIGKPGILLIGFVFVYLIGVIAQAELSDGLMSFRVFISFLLIIATSLIGLMGDEMTYSLNKVHWIFILFFMGIAPMVQVANGYIPWSYPLNETDIFKAQVAIIVWCACYSLGRWTVGRFNAKSKKRCPLKKTNMPNTGVLGSASGAATGRFLLIASLVALMIMLVKYDLSALFYRPLNPVETSALDKIVKYLCCSLPAASSVLLILMKKKGAAIANWTLNLCLVITVVLNWPAAQSRYWMGAIYGAICLTAIPDRVLQGHKFELYAVVVMGVAFPLMYALKPDVDRDFSVICAVSNFFSGKAYLSVDFDAFSMLARSMEYVSHNGIMFGLQTISAIFCFIPRSMWIAVDKSIATGEIVAKAQNAYYTNLAEPIMGEAYVDGDLIGVIVIGMAIGLVLHVVDGKWRNQSASGHISTLSLCYPFMVFLLVFVLRGALFHALMRAYGMMLAPVLICVCGVIIRRIARRNDDAEYSG